MSVSLQYKPAEPNGANKPESPKPDEKSMVELENISQKSNNRKLTRVNCNGSPQSHCKSANHTIPATKL